MIGPLGVLSFRFFSTAGNLSIPASLFLASPPPLESPDPKWVFDVPTPTGSLLQIGVGSTPRSFDRHMFVGDF